MQTRAAKRTACRKCGFVTQYDDPIGTGASVPRDAAEECQHEHDPGDHEGYEHNHEQTPACQALNRLRWLAFKLVAQKR